MDAAFQFHNQASLGTAEIDKVMTNRMLATELEPLWS
jgi:hypothetical protein